MRRPYPNIFDLGDDVVLLQKQIDAIEKDKEWGKVSFLEGSQRYLEFLRRLTGQKKKIITQYFRDFLEDRMFYDEFSPCLDILENDLCGNAGDLRLNSLVPYIATRSARPRLVVETGVAAGKSTALLLLALAHNQRGRLVSIDLANPQGRTMADGSSTSTGGKPTGWLIPSYLKSRWTLVPEDSKRALPKVLATAQEKVGVFLHDSLHTYEHALFEFEVILPFIDQERGILLCDNIEEGAGVAFSEILAKLKKVGYAYRNFAGISFHEQQ